MSKYTINRCPCVDVGRVSAVNIASWLKATPRSPDWRSRRQATNDSSRMATNQTTQVLPLVFLDIPLETCLPVWSAYNTSHENLERRDALMFSVAPSRFETRKALFRRYGLFVWIVDSEKSSITFQISSLFRIEAMTVDSSPVLFLWHNIASPRRTARLC